MVLLRFKDNHGRWIDNLDANDDLPDEVVIMRVEGPFDSNRTNYRLFTSMLKNSTKKLDKIFVSGISGDSPDFLAFLVLICNKTNSLYFESCYLSTNATSCLMAVLLMRGGLQLLSFVFQEESEFPANQAKILFEGVASSTCLESFTFDVSFVEHDQEVGRDLIHTLNRNKSLQDISLHTGAYFFDSFPEIVKASILGPKKRAVHIECLRRNIQLDMLQDVLCRKDCNLKKLHLEAVEISPGHGWDGSIMQNLSVTSLKLSEGSWGGIPDLLGLFKSLVELDLSGNDITQLSFLNPLLFGETSQLKSLDLSYNAIDEEGRANFIKKLRKNRSLKYLAINRIYRDISDSIKTALVDALRYNTDLEHIDVYHDPRLDLNRGGRRVFESLEPFPTNLLPQVLERASKILYYEPYSALGNPTNDKAGADVVFWMIQRIAPQL